MALSGLALELGTPPRVALRLPLHWQVVTFALGAWAVGARLLTGPGAGRAGTPTRSCSAPSRPTTPDDLADLVWATRLHPFGLPFTPAPAFPVEDLTPALREQPDLPPDDHGTAATVAVVVDGVEWTTAELLDRAAKLGADMGEAARLLRCVPWTSTDGWVAGVVLPALAQRSVVLVRGLDPGPVGTAALERLCAAERVDVTAGVDVAGLPRIC